ncbi:hypothetical protein ACFL1H_04810 [Nanoarchaeota archaeon]
MLTKNLIKIKQNFYKHEYDKNKFGQARENAIEIIKKEWVYLSSSFQQTYGNKSGDMYSNKILLDKFVGESYKRDALIYQVTFSNTCGQSQYLSVLIDGEFNEDIKNNFEELDFAPKNSYLATKDRVVGKNESLKVWLDDFIDIGALTRQFFKK